MNTKELLQKHFDSLRAEESEILSKTAALKAEREKWNEKASEANAKANELTEKIRAIERESGRSLFEVKMELSAVAYSLGAMKLSERTE